MPAPCSARAKYTSWPSAPPCIRVPARNATRSGSGSSAIGDRTRVVPRVPVGRSVAPLIHSPLFQGPLLLEQAVDEELCSPTRQCAADVVAPDRRRSRNGTSNVGIVREHRLRVRHEEQRAASSTQPLGALGMPVKTQPCQRQLRVAGGTRIGRAATPLVIEHTR